MLGIDNKEFEDLKRALKLSDGEQLGQELVKGCPEIASSVWGNQHLACNAREIERMRGAGVFDWLFV